MKALKGVCGMVLCAGLVFAAGVNGAQTGDEPIAASSTAPDGVEPSPAEVLGGTRTDYFSCSVGRFRGELESRVAFAAAGGSAYFDVSAVRYRIVRSGGQGGGDKANINFHLDTVNRQGVVRGNDVYSSPDSLKQDGNWHLLDINRIVRTDYQGAVTFEFIFDRSKAADSRCAAHKTYQWAGAPVARPASAE
ncbi:hypothetical protein NLK61_23295 [Pseudomonas fuscovaginae UPB0736]|uniref:Secreted protein n=1 Tax=Pseudomonas asplenii TaxID=53407 RepID=A0A1H6P5T6_9PSED|nr:MULTISPECIES: hypothetical protein [Pseudomonas]UUQ64140.1 hypothetical protein NLK61_23295 [Pseudomonas fuscovaginae UPB0736]UZE27364.1 hypothetical protein LOY63_18605 [Pseudomonas asplenii]SEI23042.1 hypothetical protein SAMN05216581_5022 [Pseudomonas fuscovaginae]